MDNRLRIGLVEDDAELRDRVIIPGLNEYGFDVTGFSCAAEFRRSTQLVRELDIAVLDLGLPDEDGFSLAAWTRTVSDVGIVMLTGRGADSDRIHGLAIGADAYLSKPVTIDVLAATLNSLNRRLNIARKTSTADNDIAPHWQLVEGGWQLQAPDGCRFPLTENERCLLDTLFASPGETISRDTLIAALASDEFDFDPHRLEMIVYRLRTKLGQAHRHPLPLRAVRGKGYVLAFDPARSTPASG